MSQKWTGFLIKVSHGCSSRSINTHHFEIKKVAVKTLCFVTKNCGRGQLQLSVKSSLTPYFCEAKTVWYTGLLTEEADYSAGVFMWCNALQTTDTFSSPPILLLRAATQWWSIWSTWQQPKSSGRGRFQTSRPEWSWTKLRLHTVLK